MIWTIVINHDLIIIFVNLLSARGSDFSCKFSCPLVDGHHSDFRVHMVRSMHGRHSGKLTAPLGQCARFMTLQVVVTALM